MLRAWLTTSVNTGINQIPVRACVLIDPDQSTYLRDNFQLIRIYYKGDRFLVSMQFLTLDPL